MKTLALVVAAVVLAGCNSDLTYEQKQEIWMLAAQDAARAQLRDGDSAEFSGLFLEHWGGDPVLCGLVNSRNGFGGYSGSQRFIYRDDTGLLIDEGASRDKFPDAWWKFCGRR